MAAAEAHIEPRGIASDDGENASSVIKVQNDDELRLAQMGTTTAGIHDCSIKRREANQISQQVISKN
jgi:hypothetical protein